MKADGYRRFLFDNVQCIAENTARMAANGKYYPVSYQELMHPKPKDMRTGEEIIADIVKKVGLEVKEDEYI